MKIKYIILLLSFLFIISCDPFYIDDYEIPTYNIQIKDNIYSDCLCNANTDYEKLDCLSEYILRTIEYEYYGPDWPEPIETFERKAGDCKGRSILFMWLAYQEFEIKPHALIHRRHKKPGHFMAEWNNFIFYKVSIKPDYILRHTFEDVLIVAKYKE